MPIVTDSGDVGLEVVVLSSNTRTIFFVASYWYDFFYLTPIYESLLVHGPSRHSSSVYDMILMYLYSILPRHHRNVHLDFTCGASFDTRHGLRANFSALSPSI